MREENKDSMGFLETAKSVLWAMLGVQSKKNASRYFSKGKASHFIIIGFLGAVIFVEVVMTAVNMMLGHLA